jgi:DNA-binding GntR family transcriptional regulator
MEWNWPTPMNKLTQQRPMRRLPDCLAVPNGASVLRIRQVIYSTNGKATIYVVGYYRCERHTLFIRRFR